MDNLTHAMAGALIGALWAGRPKPDKPGEPLSAGKAALLGAVIANLPDADLVLALHSSTAYLDGHRGLTHSLLLLPLWTLGVAALLRLWPGRETFSRYVTLAGAALLSHSLMDWAGSYGTFIFAPLSWHRYRLDWLFIIDPGFSGILALGLLAAWRMPGRRARTAGLALLVALAYAGTGGLLHKRALARWRETLTAGGFAADRIAAVPQPLSLRRWLLLADDGRTTRVAHLSLGGAPATGAKGGWYEEFKSKFRPADALSIESYPTAPAARPEDPTVVRSFMTFARFPTAWLEEAAAAGGEARLHWRDLQYGTDRRYTPFHLVAVLDSHHQPVKLLMESRRGSGKDHHFPVDSRVSMTYWRAPAPAPALR